MAWIVELWWLDARGFKTHMHLSLVHLLLHCVVCSLSHADCQSCLHLQCGRNSGIWWTASSKVKVGALQTYNKIEILGAFTMGWSCGVVVITSALHAEGPRFDPEQDHVSFFFLFSFFFFAIFPSTSKGRSLTKATRTCFWHEFCNISKHHSI